VKHETNSRAVTGTYNNIHFLYHLLPTLLNWIY